MLVSLQWTGLIRPTNLLPGILSLGLLIRDVATYRITCSLYIGTDSISLFLFIYPVMMMSCYFVDVARLVHTSAYLYHSHMISSLQGLHQLPRLHMTDPAVVVVH